MKPLLMAHRGIPWTFPENSLLSFEMALRAGCDILEFDVRLSDDRIPVIMHDATIDRTTNGSGEVAKMTLEELATHRIIFSKNGTILPGEPIPTLEQTCVLLQRFPQVVINCELKVYDTKGIDEVIDMFNTYEMLDRCVFTCFDYEVLRTIKSKSKHLKVQGFPPELMTRVPIELEVPEKLFDYIGIRWSMASKAMVEKYQKMEIVTGVWVLNEREQFHAGQRYGVDIITTDRIDLLKTARDDET